MGSDRDCLVLPESFRRTHVRGQLELDSLVNFDLYYNSRRIACTRCDHNFVVEALD